ncbi:MAG: hypothetical protein ABW005_02370 [Burkholderiaceae bacterium]
MEALTLPPQACIELQIVSQAEGFRAGDQVKHADRAGRLVSFACVADRPGAWIIVNVPGSRAVEMRRVQLVELVRVR